jgi:hypothetical protein
VQWVGGPGTCCADPAIYQRLTYDVAADTWSMAATPFSGSGHSYDAMAVDPNSHDLFFALFGDNEVKRWDGASWTALPALPWSAAVAVAMTWVPSFAEGVGALLYVNGGGRVAAFVDGDWQDLPGAAGAPWGGYSVFAEYNPTTDVVWLGGGTDGDRITYRMAADGALTRLGDAPFALGTGASLVAADPITGAFVVVRLDDGSFWEMDVMADAWTPITDMQDLPTFTGGARFQVPIPECGAILYFDHYHDTRRVYLYRHGP